MNVLKSLFKDTVIYGLASVIPRLVNILLVGLHTQVLSVSSFSVNTTFYVYAAFANVVLTYGMETAFFRFYSREKQSQKVFTTLLVALFTSTCVVFGASLFFIENIGAFFGLPPTTLGLLLGVIFFDTLSVPGYVFLRIQGKSLLFMAIKMIWLLIYVSINVCFLGLPEIFTKYLDLWDSSQQVNYIFLANLLGSSVVLLCVTPYYLKQKWVFDRELFKKMLYYGLPIMGAGLAFTINEHLDKLLIKKFLGKETMGAYSACYKLSVFLTLFIQAFRLGVEPIIFKHFKSDNAKDTYALILKYFTSFAVLGVLIVMSYLDFLKGLLIRDESYWFAINAIPIILVANVCLGIYYNLSTWYKVIDKTYFGLYFSLIGALITIIGNSIFIPKYGYIAAAYCTLLAYGVMMVLSFSMGQKKYPIPYATLQISGYILLGLSLAFLNYYYLVAYPIFKAINIIFYVSLLLFIAYKNRRNTI